MHSSASRSTLAASAIHAGALTEANLTQRAAAVLAEFAGPPVDEQLLLKIAGLAIAADEIAQGRAATLDGHRQYPPDFLAQFQVTRSRDAPGRPPRIDPGGEQCLARIDVADAHHYRVVHDERLDRHAAATRPPIQTVTVEILPERLGPETDEPPMGERLGATEHGTKPPRDR